MATKDHFVFSIDAKNHKVLVIWDLNGYGGEYEFDMKVLACSGGATKNIIPPNFSNFGEKNDCFGSGDIHT